MAKNSITPLSIIEGFEQEVDKSKKEIAKETFSKLLTKTEVFDEYNNIGVYLLYKDTELVYVGISCNLANRISTHKRTKDFDTAKIIKSSDYATCLYIENFIIEYFWPKYNNKLIKDLPDADEIKYPSGWPSVLDQLERDEREFKKGGDK